MTRAKLTRLDRVVYPLLVIWWLASAVYGVKVLFDIPVGHGLSAYPLCVGIAVLLVMAVSHGARLFVDWMDL